MDETTNTLGVISADDAPEALSIAEKLAANVQTFVDTVRAAKPSGVKGNYINGVVLSATMAPGIQVAI